MNIIMFDISKPINNIDNTYLASKWVDSDNYKIIHKDGKIGWELKNNTEEKK